MSNVLTVLERQPLARLDHAVEEVDPLIADLAVKAETELGYPALANEVRGKKRRDRVTQAPMDLVNVLCELGEPFTDSSVNEYKTLKLEEANRPLVSLREHIRNSAITLAIVLGVAFAIGYFYGGMSVPDWRTMLAWGAGLTAGVALLAVLSYFGPDKEWRCVPLENYSDQVPLHVLNKALAIRGKVPEARFFVEGIGLRDPFLVVACGDNRYYIEVWDEPSFEAKL